MKEIALEWINSIRLPVASSLDMIEIKLSDGRKFYANEIAFDHESGTVIFEPIPQIFKQDI